jgi:hypothetical protein
MLKIRRIRVVEVMDLRLGKMNWAKSWAWKNQKNNTILTQVIDNDTFDIIL